MDIPHFVYLLLIDREMSFCFLAIVCIAVRNIFEQVFVWLCMPSHFNRVQLCDPTDCSLPGSSVHGIFLTSTGVGSHSFFQGIFLTQGSNLHLLQLLCFRWILYWWATRKPSCLNICFQIFSVSTGLPSHLKVEHSYDIFCRLKWDRIKNYLFL